MCELHRKLDVVIVGGGLSGLSAACHLQSKDPSLNLLVLEAKDRIGGRTLGINLKTNSGQETWDVGGQWIGRCQHQIHSLVEELKLETFPQFSDGKKLVQLNDDGSILQYMSDIPPISYLAMVELKIFMWKVNSLAKRTKEKNFMNTKLASRLDLMSVEQYKQSYFWSSGAKNALDACCRCIFGVDPKHMSFLFFIIYVAKAGNFESLLSCKANFGAQEMKIKGGAWQICKKLAEKLPSNCIFRKLPVVSIDQVSDSQVVVQCSTGQIFSCKYVVLAIPPNEIIKINFKPQLPKVMFHVFQRMPVGYLTKVIVTYEKAFWRKKGFSGEVITSGAGNKHPLCIVFDASYEPNDFALVAFIGGEQQIGFSSCQYEDRKKIVLETLSTFFGLEALEPLDYVEKDWNAEDFNGGCPVNVATPGIVTSLTPSLFKPFKRTFFAGTESSTNWCGFMNGAVQAGRRAAVEVLYNINPLILTDKDLEDTYYTKKVQPVVHCTWCKDLCKMLVMFFIPIVAYILYEFYLF